MLDEPELIDQPGEGDDEKEGLQPLEHEQAAGAQYGEDSKSSLDLREHSSAGCQQGGDDRQHSRPLWICSHGVVSGRARIGLIVPSRHAPVKRHLGSRGPVRFGSVQRLYLHQTLTEPVRSHR